MPAAKVSSLTNLHYLRLDPALLTNNNTYNTGKGRQGHIIIQNDLKGFQGTYRFHCLV